MGANVTVMQIIHSLGAQALNSTLCQYPKFMGQTEQKTHLMLNVYSILYFLIILPCTLKV